MTVIQTFSLTFSEDALAMKAHAIAQYYGFKLNNHDLPRLHLSNDGLVLLIKGFSPLKVDFSTGFQKSKLGPSHGLIRACKPKPKMRILDLTAGWGRDASLLAAAGAEVVMVERQAVMAALLEDGLGRAPRNLSLSLIFADALTYLQQVKPSQYPDVIYIDPMHPERQKSALVKKDMQALQQLFGADNDVEVLINLALKCARDKVIVKWPQRLVALKEPDHSVSGKTIRFDVYYPKFGS